MGTIDVLRDYGNLVIMGICLCVGYILKNVVQSKKINDWIPLIAGILGLFLNVWNSGWIVTPEIILTGIFSGLASTGVYETFKNLIKPKNEE